MWVLIQTNEEKTRFKYIVSKDYNKLIKYIYSFSKIKRYGDYKFTSGDGLLFDIRLGEVI